MNQSKSHRLKRGTVMIFVLGLGLLAATLCFILITFASNASVNTESTRYANGKTRYEAGMKMLAASVLENTLSMVPDSPNPSHALTVAWEEFYQDIVDDDVGITTGAGSSIFNDPPELNFPVGVFNKTASDSRLSSVAVHLGYPSIQPLVRRGVSLSYGWIQSIAGNSERYSSASDTMMIAEIPSADFQLISAQSLFDADTSSGIIVEGKAYFNGGLKRSSGNNRLQVSQLSIVSGSLPEYTQSIQLVPVVASRGSWGGSPSLILSKAPVTGLNDSVRRFQSHAESNYLSEIYKLQLDYTDPSTDPADTPPFGISVQLRAGQPRLVIDLNIDPTWRALHINCSDATVENGIWIEGSIDARDEPLSITTNGRVYLAGGNQRNAIIGSSTGLPIPVSSAFGSGGSAANLMWRGYLVFPNGSGAISTLEDWTNSTLTLDGSLLIQGGNLSFPGTLVLRYDAAVTSALTVGDPRSWPLSDRFAIIEK